MTERGTGRGFTLSPEENKAGKVSPATPQTPQSGKRDSGYLTDFSPASGTSAGRHFTFESPFPPGDEADEADEELSALGAVGGYIGGSRMTPRTSSVTPEIDVFSPPSPMENMSGRRSRGRPRSRSSMTPDIDVFLPTPEVDEEEELAQVRFEDNCFSVVEPSLPAHMQPPNFVSRPIPIPHCNMMQRLNNGSPRMPGEGAGHMRYPSPASCPLSSSTTLHHSAGTFGSPRNTLMYFGHIGQLSRSIATQTPSQHSMIIQDLMRGGVESQTFATGSAHTRLRHHSEGEYSVEEAHTTFRLSPLPDLVPVTRDRSISLPNVPALSHPEIEVGRELRRISDEFHFEFTRGNMSPRHRAALRNHPASFPRDGSGVGFMQTIRWLIHTSTGTPTRRRAANALPRRPESTPPRHLAPVDNPPDIEET